MAKFVPDIKTQRWIVIAPQRQARPKEFVSENVKPVCPFCAGHEETTPKELYRLKDGDSWLVRVVPNKYPITDYHEVIIHSPDHDRDIENLEVSHVSSILQVYRSRFQLYLNNGQVMIFCNHGEKAGASLKHPHSQLVVIPKQINLDALVREPVMNVVLDNTFFITYCPDFSQWPYEVWIAPKAEGTLYSQISDEEIDDLAQILKNTITRLKVKYDSKDEAAGENGKSVFSYNYYIHHGQNWFIRIIPRFIHRAGFELGTGLSVNVVDPTRAAEELKNIEI
jgi:UDPglucose--hexose-1-phosphate uridylyltransferase